MEDGPKLIENWLRSKNTLEYLAAWETIHNSANFNSPEFEGIRKDAGSNRVLMSVTQLVIIFRASLKSALSTAPRVSRNSISTRHKRFSSVSENL